MYVEQIFKNILIDDNSNYIGQNTVQQEKLQIPDEDQYYNIQVPDLALYLAPLGFIFLWAVFLLFFHKVRNNPHNKTCSNSKTSPKVPCKKCLFFANNYYLKCAVKPDSVLTEEAINCSEYSPKKVIFLQKKWFP